MPSFACNSSIYNRESISNLLRKHEEAVLELEKLVADDLKQYGKSDETDDVWLLRYVLNFPDDRQAAVEAIRKTINWRMEHADLIASARERIPPEGLTREELLAIDTFYVAGFHYCTMLGDPLLIVRCGLSNPCELMNRVSTEKMFLFLTYTNESAWQYCDVTSRQKEYFVKVFHILDVSNTRLIRENRLFSAFGMTSKMNDWLYPQLHAKNFVLNAPGWINLAFRLGSAVMSRRSVERVTVHQRIPANASHNWCPVSRRLLDGASLPSFLGGTCQCNGGCCINVTDNTANTMVQPDALATHNSVLSNLHKLMAKPPSEERRVSDLNLNTVGTAYSSLAGCGSGLIDGCSYVDACSYVSEEVRPRRCCRCRLLKQRRRPPPLCSQEELPRRRFFRCCRRKVGHEETAHRCCCWRKMSVDHARETPSLFIAEEVSHAGEFLSNDTLVSDDSFVDSHSFIAT